MFLPNSPCCPNLPSEVCVPSHPHNCFVLKFMPKARGYTSLAMLTEERFSPPRSDLEGYIVLNQV
jgi:hypothetical protein